MPNISAVRSLVVPIVVQHESLSITLFARMHKVHGRDKEFRALVEEDLTIQGKMADARQALGQQVVSVVAPVEPSAPAFLQFRQDIERSLEAAREAWELPDGEDRERVTSAALADAVKLAHEFDDSTRPDEKLLKKREAAVQKKIEEINEQIFALADELTQSRARRLIYLLTPSEGQDDTQVPWDLTEGAEDAPWPLTVENVVSLGADLVTQMAVLVEGKVRGYSVAQSEPSMN